MGVNPSFFLPQLISSVVFYQPTFSPCQPLAFFPIIPFPSTASFFRHD